MRLKTNHDDIPFAGKRPCVHLWEAMGATEAGFVFYCRNCDTITGPEPYSPYHQPTKWSQQAAGANQ